VHAAFKDADVLIYLTDIFEHPEGPNVPEALLKTTVPVIIALNKIDRTNQLEIESCFAKWKKVLPNAEQIAISALHNFNMDSVISLIVKLLPENPPYYDKDTLTDKSTRFFVTEIIREKILLYYHKEIPYSVEIEIEEFKVEEDIVRISSLIHVIRDSQKGIIIGDGGKAIKKLGTEARKDLEKFLGKKVFIQLYVKVQKNWRDNVLLLKKFGYID